MLIFAQELTQGLRVLDDAVGRVHKCIAMHAWGAYGGFSFSFLSFALHADTSSRYAFLAGLKMKVA